MLCQNYKPGDNLTKMIHHNDVSLLLLKEIQKILPNLIYKKGVGKNNFYLADKSVNKLCNFLSYESNYTGLWVIPQYKLSLNVENVNYDLIVKSIPGKVQLIDFEFKNRERYFRFPASLKNLKNYGFDHNMIYNESKYNIYEYIKDRPDTKLDLENVDPAIRKILILM